MAEPRSPWFWVLTGCAGLMIIAGVIVAGLAFWGWRAAKDFEAGLKDPERREEKVLEALGAERIPDGWTPVMAFSVPFLFKMAMLTSGDEVISTGEADIDIGESMFIFVEMIGRSSEEALRRFEEGGDVGAMLRDANINYDLEREFGRGALELAGGTMVWVSGIGEADLQQGSTGEGLTAIGVVDCETDRKSRFVLWVEPIPDGSLDDPEVLRGTPADPDYLGSFLGHFTLCPQ